MMDRHKCCPCLIFFTLLLKVSKYGVFSGLYFPVFGLSMTGISVIKELMFYMVVPSDSIFRHGDFSCSAYAKFSERVTLTPSWLEIRVFRKSFSSFCGMIP